MRRKQITYAHKRNRNREHALQESNSSPLEDISNPEQYLTCPEMTRRILKRSRRSGSVTAGYSLSQGETQGSPFKKLKISASPEHGPTQDVDLQAYTLQTPHPTQLTEDQVFKLESSRGLPLSPGHEFSPVPLVSRQRKFLPVLSEGTTSHRADEPNIMRSTSSRNLKENAALQQ